MLSSYMPLIYRKLTTAAITSGIAAILFATLWSPERFAPSFHIFLLYAAPFIYIIGFPTSLLCDCKGAPQNTLATPSPVRSATCGLRILRNMVAAWHSLAIFWRNRAVLGSRLLPH
ncbi:hypothetical protein SAMN05518847_107279 [Paenibacillus sp. OV219]|nr:hypothetical protein SAMN05518847_107279 [Paenibacillus sp. OV219]